MKYIANPVEVDCPACKVGMCSMHGTKRGAMPMTNTDQQLRYASYANHMAIQKKVAMTWHAWLREQRSGAQEAK
jgi:hypothetical protein